MLSMICWVEDLVEGFCYYDMIIVVVEVFDMFIFVLLSDMNQVVDMDGYGVIFEGVYNYLMFCCNLVDIIYLLDLDNELFNLMIDFSIYDLGGFVFVGSMFVQLIGEVVYILMVIIVMLGEIGNYCWLVFSQNGMQLLDMNDLFYLVEVM